MTNFEVVDVIEPLDCALPGPVDKALLLLVAVPLFVFYRRPMREAWESAVGSLET